MEWKAFIHCISVDFFMAKLLLSHTIVRMSLVSCSGRKKCVTTNRPYADTALMFQKNVFVYVLTNFMLYF